MRALNVTPARESVRALPEAKVAVADTALNTNEQFNGLEGKRGLKNNPFILRTVQGKDLNI